MNELFILWCLYPNTRILSIHFVFRTLKHVMQTMRVAISMGHIITRLALYFTSRDLSMNDLRRYMTGTFNAKTLIKAEVIQEWRSLQELDTRSYYLFRQYALWQLNSLSSKDEESDEASSNEDWVKRKKSNEKAHNWQQLHDRLERMELSINETLYEA